MYPKYSFVSVDVFIRNRIILKTSKIPYIDMNEARCFYVNIDLENMPRKGKQWNSFVWGDHKQSMDQKPFGVELVTKLRKVSTKV